MKLYKITIIPISNFSTTLKGDTLFGQMCWAIRYKYGEVRLNELLSNYEDKPFMIVSDAFAKDFLPKPKLPSFLLGENIDRKKENRKKIWLSLDDLKNGCFTNAKSNEEIGNVDKAETVLRNSINYKTSSTDGDGFDPYGESENSISQKDIYFLIDSSFSAEELKNSFELLSQMGYGKDTTIGKGRFEFTDFQEVDMRKESTSFMALSPFVANGLKCDKLFYEPFTRFGKHGAELANKNPFKKPIILANSAAVINFSSLHNLDYVGHSVKGHSAHSNTVHQGYSIVIPIKGLNHE